MDVAGEAVAGLPTAWEGRWYDVVLGGRPVGRVRAQRGARERGLLAEQLLQESGWQIGPFTGSLRPGGRG